MFGGSNPLLGIFGSGFKKWFGELILLEVDYIDGDRINNNKNNLSSCTRIGLWTAIKTQGLWVRIPPGVLSPGGEIGKHVCLRGICLNWLGGSSPLLGNPPE